MDRWVKIKEFIEKEMTGEQIAGTDHLERAYEWCQRVGGEVGIDRKKISSILLQDYSNPLVRKRQLNAHYQGTIR